MSGGIKYLMKKNKIQVINGFGKVKKNNKVEVNYNGDIKEFSGKNIIIATIIVIIIKGKKLLERSRINPLNKNLIMMLFYLL